MGNELDNATLIALRQKDIEDMRAAELSKPIEFQDPTLLRAIDEMQDHLTKTLTRFNQYIIGLKNTYDPNYQPEENKNQTTIPQEDTRAQTGSTG